MSNVRSGRNSRPWSLTTLSGVVWTALMFVLADAAWSQCEQSEFLRIENPTPQERAYFGWSIALNEDFLFVGANRDHTYGEAHGIVHVFDRRDPLLPLVQSIVPQSPSNVASFGRCMAVEGNRLVVGAPFEWETGFREGAAYVFEYDGQHWLQTARLTASDSAPQRTFGSTIALHGDTIIVGNAQLFEATNGDALYVFTLHRGNWAEFQRLQPPFAPPHGSFGMSIDIEDATIVVGSPVFQGEAGVRGRVDIFRLLDDSWQFSQTITTSAEEAWFGFSVSLHGESLVIGAPQEFNVGFARGAAYVFRPARAGWVESSKLLMPEHESEPGRQLEFGTTVVASSCGLLVGAADDGDSIIWPGKTYLFRERAGEWVISGKFTISNAQDTGWLGPSIATMDGLAVIGARSHSTDGLYASGTVGLFDVSEPLGAIRFVDSAAPDGGDGLSWAAASNDLMSTSLAATPGDEIWIAQGTYRPVGPDGRNEAFELPCNAKLYGGFPTGGGDGTFGARDPNQFPTILSGDIGVPDDHEDNSYNIIRMARYDSNVVLDGIDVRDADAVAGEGSLVARQGAIIAEFVDLTLANCGIDQNRAIRGAGVNIRDGALVVRDCAFTNNTATESGGGVFAERTRVEALDSTFDANTTPLTGRGGAIYVRVGDCDTWRSTFVGNQAGLGGALYWYVPYGSAKACLDVERGAFYGNQGGHGGAIYASGSHIRIRDTGVTDNSAASFAGGAHVTAYVEHEITNCIFARNVAARGGALRVDSRASSRISNCTIVQNTASHLAGAVFGGRQLDNCIVRQNASALDAFAQFYTHPDMSHCNIEGGWENGENIIDLDPRFVDPDNGDFRLLPGSPCIDAGDNALLPPDELDLDNDGDTAEPIPFDLHGNHRVAFGRVDMGAFEVQPPRPPADCSPAGGDGRVSVADLLAALTSFGTGPSPCDTQPINPDGTLGDGVVSLGDILAIISSLQ